MLSSGENHASWIQPEEEDLLDRFEHAWRTRPPADLKQFLPGDEEERRECVLGELIKIDLEYRWRTYGGSDFSKATGDEDPSHAANGFPITPVVEDYLARHPQLQLSPELIAEEYRVRCRWGDAPQPDEYLRRFPQFIAELPGWLHDMERELRSESTQSDPAGTRREESGGLAANGSSRPSPDNLNSLGPDDMATMCDPSEADRPSGPGSHEAKSTSHDRAKQPLPKQIGRYEVVSLLGEGAFGAVYLANDPQLKRQAAIKTPHRRHLRHRRSRKQFLDEAQLAAQLKHPVLVSIYDIHAQGDEFYLVMEYIDGKPLANVLHDDWASRRDLRYAAEMLADIAEAVHEAHKRGLVHRDLKPANILIDRAGRPHVTDFGLALHEEDQRGRAWEVSGTPAYMAPEQVRGESHRLDGRCDIWSLGAILYEMITGRRAFAGRKVHDVFDEIVHREPKPPRQIDDSIPIELERICLRCLAKDVSARYTTARDLCDDLRRFLESDFIEGAELSLLRSRSIYRSASVVSASTHQSELHAGAALPQPAGAFVGREREAAEIRRLLLDEKVPVVTLLGPGGMGKTRLAQHVAHALAQPFPGGAWWADLAAVTTEAGIGAAVLAAFGATAASGESPEERVANLLHYRRRLLLVLDNFEQVARFAQETVGLWRQRAPHVQFLVTSREPLGLAGERQYELSPLEAPPAGKRAESAAEVGRYPSVELFVRRAQEADPRFRLDDANAADVAQICAQLEGLPLAVELAAARVKILKPAQMLKKFGQKFQFLKSTRRDLSDRQRTLEGAIQWSYDHLEEWERRAFLQVSAFAGGFFLEAAEAVIDLDEFPEAPPAIDVVQSLREQCLLRTVDERYELRLGMYQSIREFGEQKRRAVFSPDEEAALEERLAEYLIGYCESWSQAIHTQDGLEALDRVALETENLFAVQDWAEGRDCPDLAARAILSLAETVSIRGPADQRRSRLERAVKRAPKELQAPLLTQLSLACHASGDWDLAAYYADQAVAEASFAAGRTRDALGLTHAARALRQKGIMRRLRGDMQGALESFRQSEDTARQSDARHDVAAAIAQRGFLGWQCGEFDQALQCYAQAEAITRELGDQAEAAMIVRQRGQLRAQRGEYAEALEDFERTESLAVELGDLRLLHLTISARGAIYSDQGRYDDALECFERAERLARQLGEKRGVAVNRGNRGLVYADRGDYEKALSYYADAEALNRALGVTAGIALNIGNRGVALAGLGRYEEALACLEEAEQLHHKLGSRLQEAITRGERGAVLLALGKLEEAHSALSGALATFDGLNAGHTPDCFNFLTSLAAIHARSGNPDTARHDATRAQSLADTLGLTPQHPRLRIRESLEILEGLKSSL
jgi:non-specific serine/threonine protein kinase